MDIQFVKTEISIESQVGNELIPSKEIIICMKDNTSGILLPHPISNFIKKYFVNKGASLNHQKNAAYTITRFFNFILEEIHNNNESFIHLKEEGIPSLNREHATAFLNHLSLDEKLSHSTIKIRTSYITQFYDFLHKQKIINIPFLIQEKEINHKITLVNPFPDVAMPKNNDISKLEKKKDIVTRTNENRLQMIREFLITAHLTEPSIALGVAFLFLGGLRMGECINLTKSSVKIQNTSLYGEDGIILELRDNQKTLFNHLRNTTDAEVKKPRNQAILIDKMIPFLYKNHIDYLEKMEKKSKNKEALFLNPKTGLPITPRTFRLKFNNVKEKYLETLSKTEGRFQDFYDLSNSHWSTHIGRGTFTNLIISAGFTVEQTAIARGDSNINSALHYTDQMAANHNIKHALEIISNKESLEIDISPFKKTWNEVVHFGKI